MTKPNPKTAAAEALAIISKAKTSAGSHQGITKRGGLDYYIDPASIIIEPGWNDRFDYGDIAELSRQIKAQKKHDGHGLLNKIRVQRTADPLKFRLIDGERRTLAIHELLKEGEVWEFGIPVWIESKEASDVDLMVKKIVANDGKKFLPLEEAQAFAKLKAAGLSIAEICEKVGRAHPHVQASLALLSSDESLQTALKTGAINSTTAKKIAVTARGDVSKQRELVEAATSAGTDKKAKRKAAQKIEEARIAKAEKAGRTLKMRALTDEQLAELGARVLKLLETKVKEARWSGATKSEDDLAALMETVKGDDGLAAAFTLGSLMALKAAAGQKVNLDI